MLEQTLKVYQIMRGRFSRSQSDCFDEMIAGSLCQAGGEDVSSIDRKAASWTHMQAAMRMIRKRGGPKASVHTNLKLLFF
jgi:hypothetical protein